MLVSMLDISLSTRAVKNWIEVLSQGSCGAGARVHVEKSMAGMIFFTGALLNLSTI